MAWKIGPHDQNGWPAGVDWARRANVVKSVGNPAAMMAAPDHALRLYRWPFSPAQQADLVRRGDYVAFGSQLLAGLAGYNHRNLWLEGPNEPGEITDELIAFYRGLKEWLEERGHRLTGPCSATGDYDDWEVEKVRALGLSLWTFHAYWTKKYGPTVDNAWRWRQFWRPGDPPVVIGECGYDQCNDVPGGGLEPPAGTENCGWQAQGVSDEEMVAALVAYSDSLTNEYEWGAVAFTTSPNDEWKRKGFDLDPIAPRMAALYQPWTPEVPPVATIKGVDVSNWQRYPDFGRVKAAGYEFAFIKVSEDDYGDADYYDPYAAGNWANAKAAGLVRGVYHFVRPSKSSPAESVTVLQRAIDKIGGLAPGDLVAVDIEDEKVLGSQHVWVAEMLDLTERVLGFAPFKYSGDWYTSTRDLEHDDLARYPTWWASYQAEEPPPQAGWAPIRIWQYGAHATVPGVEGDCDVDQFDGTVAELRALGKPVPVGVDWEAPVFAPIYQGASTVGAMPDKTPEDEQDAQEVIRRMDAMKQRHPAA